MHGSSLPASLRFHAHRRWSNPHGEHTRVRDLFHTVNCAQTHRAQALRRLPTMSTPWVSLTYSTSRRAQVSLLLSDTLRSGHAPVRPMPIRQIRPVVARVPHRHIATRVVNASSLAPSSINLPNGIRCRRDLAHIIPLRKDLPDQRAPKRGSRPDEIKSKVKRESLQVPQTHHRIFQTL